LAPLVHAMDLEGHFLDLSRVHLERGGDHLQRRPRLMLAHPVGEPAQFRRALPPPLGPVEGIPHRQPPDA
jgi:hypothetical protein